MVLTTNHTPVTWNLITRKEVSVGVRTNAVKVVEINTKQNSVILRQSDTYYRHLN